MAASGDYLGLPDLRPDADARGANGRPELGDDPAGERAVAEEPVCLVDGSLQFSDLRGLLRAPADARSFLDLPTDKIREGDVSEVMFRDPSGIDVLLAPPRVEMAEMITTRDIEKALSLLRNVALGKALLFTLLGMSVGASVGEIASGQTLVAAGAGFGAFLLTALILRLLAGRKRGKAKP